MHVLHCRNFIHIDQADFPNNQYLVHLQVPTANELGKE